MSFSTSLILSDLVSISQSSFHYYLQLIIIDAGSSPISLFLIAPIIFFALPLMIFLGSFVAPHPYTHPGPQQPYLIDLT